MTMRIFFPPNIFFRALPKPLPIIMSFVLGANYDTQNRETEKVDVLIGIRPRVTVFLRNFEKVSVSLSRKVT
jgi:hypothetical protein